ncbi:MAG: DUF4065 domain-containing protein [Flavobacteriaceae bacterium]|nr:DUF4065 domain-containing protein [Flavobacteriaceae bacterium]MCY4267978.1 DUF4065 domain-containing protein [Flavobacteriaceae bacterium]
MTSNVKHQPPYDACNISNHLIEIAEKNKKRLSILRLVKLVYLSHAWSLANLDRPLIKEKVEAWRYGPIIPSVYFLFRSVIREENLNTIKQQCPEKVEIDVDSKNLIQEVYDYYKSFDDYELISLTHKKGESWYKVFHRYSPDRTIPNKSIRRDFIKKRESVA